MKQSIKELFELFKNRHYMLRQGNKFIQSRFPKYSIQEIKEARNMYRMYLKKTLIKNQDIPKILLFDLETAPMKAYVWKRWKENISLEQTITEGFILCWSAKWLYSDEIMGECLTPSEIYKENDERIVRDLWLLLDKADIVIAHNGDSFDIKTITGRFVYYNMMPPSKYFKIDTLKIARQAFRFSSNKLDALAGYFNIDHKLDTGFDLWKQCMEGDLESLDYMLKYNKKDVEILELVYLRIRPYANNHPNINTLLEKDCCSICGSENLTAIKDKFYYTPTGKYQLYRCLDCGTVIRGRKNLMQKPDYQNIKK